MAFYDELINGDWLGRDPNEYTYEKKGHSSGWELTLTKGDAFSKLLMRVDSQKIDTEKKLLLTKSACNSLVSRMLMADTSKRMPNIRFSSEFTSYQQGNNLVVTVEPLTGRKVKFPTFNHALDPVLGYCVHEAAHLLYTDRSYGAYLNRSNAKDLRFKSMILNIVEDERIECKIASAFRGYTNYLGKAKDYCWGNKYEDELKFNSVDQDSEVVQLASTFILLVRYPKAVDEELVNKFEKPLREIMSILTPFPATLNDLFIATDAIYAVFQRFITPEEEQQQQQGGKQGKQGQQGQQGQQSQSSTSDENSSEGSQSGSGSSDGGDPQNSQNKEDNPQEQGDTPEEQKEGQKSPQNKPDTDKDGNDTNEKGNGEGEEDNTDESSDSGSSKGKEEEEGEESDNGGSGEDSDKEEEDDADGDNSQQGQQGQQPNEPVDLEEVLEALVKSVMSAVSTDMSTAEVASKLGVLERTLDKIQNLDKDELDSLTSQAHTYPETENLRTSELKSSFKDSKDILIHNRYDDALAEVRPFATSLRAKLQELNRNHTYTNRGLMEGDFDDGLLVDALLGSKSVYKEDTKVQNRGACIGLLIDESGSMHSQKRWFEAMKIAVMFERALDGVNNVDFYCYGHTTDNVPCASDATIIHTYFEGRKKSDRKCLGKINAYGMNRDGHAILEVVGRMRKRVDKDIPIILFMVSDGEPSASVPTGYNGKTFTKKAVDMVEKYDNATVIHVAIDQGIPSKDMFKYFVELTNYGTLVRDIGSLLKKLITKQQMIN